MQDTIEIADSARPATRRAIDRLRNRDQVAGTYSVVLDRTWAAERLAVTEELAGLVASASTTKDARRRIGELEEHLKVLEEQRGEAVLEFRFRHCSPVRYEALMAEHRPTEKQREDATAAGGRAPNFAPSFRPAFVHEVLISPEMSEAEVHELFGEATEESLLSPGEAAELFTAAMIASQTVPRFEPRT